MAELRAITEDNFIDAFNLRLAPEQESFVSHPIRSLAQAYVYRNRCQPFGIYAEDKMIGYVMVIYDYDIPEYGIRHMMIDESMQGRGYGGEALDRVIDYIRTKPFGDSDRIVLTCNKTNDTARNLYESKGFSASGVEDEDEIELVMTINRKMDRMIENMISWATEKLGSTEYAGWCLSFIEDALEISNGIEIFGGDSAKESSELYKDALRDGIPERGAFVFYDCLCPGEGGPVNWGHCGISLGDGRLIHAWDKVRTDDCRKVEQMTALTGDHPKYIGWVPVMRVLAQESPKMER